MEKQPKIELTQDILQNVDEEWEPTEEDFKRWEEEEEQWKKEGYTAFEISKKRFGPIMDYEKLGITEEILRKWDEEDEQWRKEGLSWHEIVKRHFGPLMDKIDNDIHWE